MTIRGRSAAAVLLATLPVTGCFPAVVHGPRVQAGLGGSLTASVAAGPTHTEGDMGGMRTRNATVGAGLGYGWRGATQDRPSVFAGLHVPIFFPLAQLDVYVQAPESWLSRSVGGVGVNVSVETATPYLQWGRVSADGRGWSTIQGVSFRYIGGEERTTFAWTPGLVAHLGSARVPLHLYTMAALGRHRTCTYEAYAAPVCGPRGTYAVLAGATLELRRTPAGSRR